MCAETLEDFIDLNYANGLSSIVVKIHEFKFQCRVCFSSYFLLSFTKPEDKLENQHCDLTLEVVRLVPG